MIVFEVVWSFEGRTGRRFGASRTRCGRTYPMAACNWCRAIHKLRKANDIVHCAMLFAGFCSMPKCHGLPFLVWCIAALRVPLLFLVELGAAISVASTTVPVRSAENP